jgi:hypothetical protein
MESEGSPGQQLVTGDLVLEGCHQAGGLRVTDAAGVFRQWLFLGITFRPREQSQPLVGHKRHDVAVALDGL